MVSTLIRCMLLWRTCATAKKVVDEFDTVFVDQLDHFSNIGVQVQNPQFARFSCVLPGFSGTFTKPCFELIRTGHVWESCLPESQQTFSLNRESGLHASSKHQSS